ncbi:hypothetical protein [Methanosarcina sp.]|uniref:hypothetical protein n=1 Tax=Methanosarcina sp. TaxID=2213 RepID=UPI003C7872A0
MSERSERKGQRTPEPQFGRGAIRARRNSGAEKGFYIINDPVFERRIREILVGGREWMESV